jgi:hypothetical protein
MENSIDVQQYEGGGGVDRKFMVMPLRRSLSWRWSESIDESIFLISDMRRKAKRDGIWEANTKEETQEKRIRKGQEEKKKRYALIMASIVDLRQIFHRTLTTSNEMDALRASGQRPQPGLDVEPLGETEGWTREH